MSDDKKRVFCADFETYTEEPAEVFLWCVKSLDGDFEYIGREIGEFLDYVKSNPGIYYFHNLKFDGSFILPDLEARGIGYQTFITGMAKRWYLIKFYASEMRDSQKLMPMSLAKYAQAVGIDGKLDCVYDFPHGLEVTDALVDYIKRDVDILRHMVSHIDTDALTIGSHTMREYQAWLKSRNANFRKIYPQLEREEDDYIRKSYRGGFCYLNPRYRDDILDEVSIHDAKSMYAHVMCTHRLPYGTPRFTTSERVIESGDDGIISVFFDFNLKEGCIPFLSPKPKHLRYLKHDYMTKSITPVRMTMTTWDWDTIQQYYDVTIYAYGERGCTFKTSADLFDGYLDPLYRAKEDAENDFDRLWAKQRMTSLYGKFGTAPKAERYLAYCEDGKVEYVGMDEEVKPSFTAVSSFITSGARCYLIDTIQMNAERFIYCDTDSIHLTGDEPLNGDYIGCGEMGCWDRKYTDDRIIKARYHGEKSYYLLHESGEATIRAGGIHLIDGWRCDINDFESGLEIPTRESRLTAGGTLIEDITKRLK